MLTSFRDMSSALRKKRILYNILSATVMLFVFGVYLTTISLQMDSGRYTASNTATRRALDVDTAANAESVADVWDWIDSLATRIGGRSMRRILSLCEYDSPAMQTVTIENTTVTIVDPSTPSYPCQFDMGYFIDDESEVVLSGNNQLLSFGVFFTRSPYHSSGKHEGHNVDISVKRGQRRIRSRRDDKFIKLANSSWGECVLEDGFIGDAGATLLWSGRVVGGIIAFDKDSTATVNSKEVLPCYTHSISPEGEVVLQAGHELYSLDDVASSETRDVFLQRSVDFFSFCFQFMNTPSPLMSYFAMKYNVSDVSLVPYYSRCTEVLKLSSSELSNSFELENDLIPIRLGRKNKWHEWGTFFSCSNEMDWVEDSHVELNRLKAFEVLDDNTRKLEIYAVSRNLGANDLFYTASRVTFTFDVSGKISVDFTVSNAPIVHFIYGFDGYTSPFYLTLVFEILFAVLFGLFCIREFYHLYSSGVSALKMGLVKQDQISPEIAPAVVPANESRLDSAAREVEGSESNDVEAQDSLPNQSETAPPLAKITDENKGILQRTVSYFTKEEDLFDNVVVPDTLPIYTILDVVTIVVVAAAIAYRVTFVTQARDLHNFVSSLNLESAEYDNSLARIVDLFYEVESSNEAFHACATLGIVVGVAQFFRYISFDPRLSIVTATVQHSVASLLPVLGVFLTVMIAYGIIGQALYGSLMPEWSTLSKSLNTLFLFVLGEVGLFYESKYYSFVAYGRY